MCLTANSTDVCAGSIFHSPVGTIGSVFSITDIRTTPLCDVLLSTQDRTGERLPSQVLSEQDSATTAFGRFVRAHAALTRRLSGLLLERHGLTLNDFEVLLHLAHAPDRRLRRADLADQVVLTPSGITRLLDGLERAGLVAPAERAADRRVVYAELTDKGLRRFEESRTTHRDAIRTLFAASFRPEEIETLGELLGRLPGAGGDPGVCGA